MPTESKLSVNHVISVKKHYAREKHVFLATAVQATDSQCQFHNFFLQISQKRNLLYLGWQESECAEVRLQSAFKLVCDLSEREIFGKYKKKQ